MKEDRPSRASRLRLRLYEEHGYGSVSRLARGIGMSRTHVSLVLNEQYVSEETLDKIERWLEEQDQPQNHAA